MNNLMHKPWPPDFQESGIWNYRFLIEEDNPAWPELKWRLGGEHTFITTEFTKDEIMEAEWCIARAIHSIESLRPEGYGWHKEYYATQCPKCGSGWRQIAPFKIKREPNVGKNQFASFGSAFEMFCTRPVLEAFEREGVNGFETWPIFLNRENRACEGLRQIQLTYVSEPAIAEELVEHERYRQTDCEICGRTWHTHYVRGMLPLRRSKLHRHLDLQLTNEWFGSEFNSRREILASQRLVRIILEKKWKGIDFIPIQVV